MFTIYKSAISTNLFLRGVATQATNLAAVGEHGRKYWEECTAALATVPPALLGGTLPFTPRKDAFMLGPEELQHAAKMVTERTARASARRAEAAAARGAAAAAAALAEEEEERDGIWGTDGFEGIIPEVDEEEEEAAGRGAVGSSDEDEED